jgi:uncharacterized protein (DUF433 family)
MENTYIEERAGTYYVRGLKVQLSQVILQWREGEMPEAIALNFSALTSAQVYGAIAFYLEHHTILDEHFKQIWSQERAITHAHYQQNAERYASLQNRFAAIKAHEASIAS